MAIIVKSLFSLTEKQIYTLDTTKNTLILEYYGVQNYNFTLCDSESIELPNGEIIGVDDVIDVDDLTVVVCSIESCKLSSDNVLIVKMSITVLEDVRQAVDIVF